MPATKFICPDGTHINITDCLQACPYAQRCMFLPNLRAVANSLDRKISEPTVTELLDDNDGVLGDLKVTSSFKLMKALGIYKQKVATGELYKSGIKKGLPKFRSELRFDGVRDLLDWAIQLNYYRILLERAGFTVNRMFIQALCRDSGLRIAQERGISKPVYIIPINKISDHWLNLYFQHKAKLLRNAIRSNILPPVCSVGATENVWATAPLAKIVPTLKISLTRKCFLMNSSLRLFTLKVNSTSNSITPHVRYISPDNVLNDRFQL